MLRFSLRLPESGSLKDKRQVVRSVTQRIRNKFQVSVAEVGDNEAWQIATLGVACVSNEARHCEEMLSAIVAYVEGSRLDAEVVDVETDVVAMG
ncbi:MAG TPA: DUF503 domain-containing protein [Dehalococcoidia bacterium]|nr:DUF503 domain-containing protein [Dehalococcoidia bacterium]